jgi:hypothetical protein
MLMQVWTLVKLNFNRLILKSKAKWVLLMLVGFEIALFVLVNNVISNTPNSFAGVEYEVESPSQLFFDDSAAANVNVPSLFASYFSNVTQVKKRDFLEAAKTNSGAAYPILVEFLSDREYNFIIVSDSISRNSIYGCLGKSCGFQYVDQTVVMMSKVDAALSNATTPPLKIINRQTTSTGIAARDNFLDFFYFIIASLLVKGLIEDRKKGIKFGLFMTGVKRSWYFVNSFEFIHGDLCNVFHHVNYYVQKSGCCFHFGMLLFFDCSIISSVFLVQCTDIK